MKIRKMSLTTRKGIKIERSKMPDNPRIVFRYSGRKRVFRNSNGSDRHSAETLDRHLNYPRLCKQQSIESTRKFRRRWRWYDKRAEDWEQCHFCTNFPGSFDLCSFIDLGAHKIFAYFSAKRRQDEEGAGWIGGCVYLVRYSDRVRFQMENRIYFERMKDFFSAIS